MRHNTGKRVFLLFPALAMVLFLLAGCSGQNTPVIEVSKSSVTRSGLNYSPRVSEEYIWMEGSVFTLQRLVDGNWVDITPIAPMIFSTEYLFVRSDEEQSIDWSGFYGVLENGTYRLVKKYERYSGQLDANGLPTLKSDHSTKTEFTCYGEFKITSQTPER